MDYIHVLFSLNIFHLFIKPFTNHMPDMVGHMSKDTCSKVSHPIVLVPCDLVTPHQEMISLSQCLESGLGEAQNVETSFFFTEQRASRKPEIKTVSKSWSKWQWKSQGHQFPQTSSICQNLIKIKWKTSLLKEDIQLRDVWGASKGYFHTKKLIVCPLKTSVSLENQWADTCPLLSNFFL